MHTDNVQFVGMSFSYWQPETTNYIHTVPCAHLSVCSRVSCGGPSTCWERRWITTVYRWKTTVSRSCFFSHSHLDRFLFCWSHHVFPGCTGAEVVLSVMLNNPIVHHNSRGQTVKLSFSCEHQRELEEAARRVFMVSVCSPVHLVTCLSVCSPVCLVSNQRAQSSQRVKDPGSTVPPPADKYGGRSYNRKKPQNKSHLKSECEPAAASPTRSLNLHLH